MKKIRIVLALITPLVFTTALSAKNPSWRQTENPWESRNSIIFVWNGFSGTSYNASGYFESFSLEYDRFISDRFSLSLTGHYNHLPGRLATDTHTVAENYTLIAAKANYSLPIVGNWLYLRGGVGIGAGIHDITGVSWGWHAPEGYEDVDTETMRGTKVRPELIVDLNIVFRVSRHIDILLSPLIITPSRLIFGPAGFNEPYDSPYLNIDFFKVGVAARF